MTAKGNGPKKGVKPRLDGVAGELLSEIPSDVVFGSQLRQSPYDPLLVQLRDAGEGSVLRFGDIRAKASVWARAKKMGLKLMFGERGGELFVKLAPKAIEALPAPELVPSVMGSRDRNRGLVIAAIRKANYTPGAIATWIRANGNPAIDAPVVGAILRSLMKDGKVIQKSISGDTWQIREEPI